MKNDSNQKNCRNCNASLPLDALFCSNCSQKYTTGKVPFYSFISDFLQHYFNLDSRFFRTLTALFIPGKLTREYFLGKHKSYSNPLQLFLVPAFFLFALVSWNISKADFGDNAFIRLKQDLDWIDFHKNLDSAKVQTDSLFINPIALAATDTLRKKLKAHYPYVSDSLDIGDFGEIHPSLSIPTIAKKDLLSKSSDELVELYAKDRSFIEKLILGQTTKFKKGGRGIIEFFISKLSITLLLMMPILALILKLFYIRHDYFYVEHLIFTLHFHAFSFIVILALGLFGRYLPELVITFSILSIFAYLFFAMKKVYHQGKGKTFLKYISLLCSYLFLAAAFSAFAMLVSFLLF